MAKAKQGQAARGYPIVCGAVRSGQRKAYTCKRVAADAALRKKPYFNVCHKKGKCAMDKTRRWTRSDLKRALGAKIDAHVDSHVTSQYAQKLVLDVENALRRGWNRYHVA
jgi:hypothetical protein